MSYEELKAALDSRASKAESRDDFLLALETKLDALLPEPKDR